MQLTVDNKITLIYSILLLLFVVAYYAFFIDTNTNTKEHFGATDGTEYIYNGMTGATLGNVTINGALSAGNITIDQTSLSVKGTGGNIKVNSVDGNINVGNITITNSNGIKVNNKQFMSSGGVITGTGIYDANGNIVMGPTTISSIDGTIRTTGNVKLGDVTFGPDGSMVSVANNLLGTRRIINVDGTVNITALNVGNCIIDATENLTSNGTLTTKTLTLAPNSDLVVGGILTLPNQVKFSTFATDGHVELVVGKTANTLGYTIYYGPDGTIRTNKNVI